MTEIAVENIPGSQKRFLKFTLLVDVYPGDGYWEAKSPTLPYIARADSPENAMKEYEKVLKLEKAGHQERKVFSYEDIKKQKEAERAEKAEDLSKVEVDKEAIAAAIAEALEEAPEASVVSSSKKKGKSKKVVQDEFNELEEEL